MATQSASGIETNLGFILEQVAREKGIEKKVLTETVEAAIHKAAQSVFGATRELEARFNEDTGQVDLFLYMTVVEEVTQPEREISTADVEKRRLDAELGEELGFQVFWHPADAAKAKQQDEEFGELLQLKQARSAFGRIAAQTAKQVLLSRVRDAERDLIFQEFKDRQGELIKGIVRRFEKGNNLIVDLGKTEGILPLREQTPRETYRPGDRIVALVKTIDREARGPQVILSRSDARLVEKLFEAEVPEIYEGIVKIVGVAREPGARSKIAVSSRDGDVDPVGACVGMKGSRVQAVVQELRGEKIDIVPHDKDSAKYVIAAIQPAEVMKVVVDGSDHRMELIVPDEKLSLAIGRKGQNVRLAAQLTGWRLDIISESKFKQLEDESIRGLALIPGVNEELARALYRSGFRTAEEITDAPVEDLATIPGMTDEGIAERIRESAETSMETLRQDRLKAAIAGEGLLSEKDKLRLVEGVGDRTAEILTEAGYGSIDAILREDVDRLAMRTGMGHKRARTIKEGARLFLDRDALAIQSGRNHRHETQAHETPAGDADLRMPSARSTSVPKLPRKGLRICVGCGRRDVRGALVRFVATGEDGTRVTLDPGSFQGKRSNPARGAHVHPRRECLVNAAKRGLSRSFRRTMQVRPEGPSSPAAIARTAAETETNRLLGVARRLRLVEVSSEAADGLLIVATDAPGALAQPDVAAAVTTGRAIALGTRATNSRLFGAPMTDVMRIAGSPLATSLARVWAIRNAVGSYGVAAEDG
jgi:N utilization substance protein A